MCSPPAPSSTSSPATPRSTAFPSPSARWGACDLVNPRIQIVVGTTRPGRFSEKPVAWLVDRLGDRDDLRFEVVDLRDHPLPMYESAVSPARAERAYDDPRVARFGEIVDRADGYLIVTSEYNHGYPAVLKNA